MLNLLLPGTAKDYRNYRWFITSNGNFVVGGKSDEQNEIVIKNFLRPEYIVMHTSEPGSPFCILLNEKPMKKDLDETAVFCGCFSQQWKKISGSGKISIDIFKGEQIYKVKGMKLGTFGVKGEKKIIKIKPELFVVMQKGKIRAVPSGTKEKILAKIVPGKLTKEDASGKIAKIIRDKYDFPVSKEEIMQAIPSGNLNVK